MPDCGQLYSIFASTYKLMDCISTEALRTVSFSETTLNCGLDPYHCCIFWSIIYAIQVQENFNGSNTFIHRHSLYGTMERCSRQSPSS